MENQGLLSVHEAALLLPLGVVRGGFYFDCDIEPLHALAPFCRRGLDCVLFMEGHQGLSNAAFGAKPNHPFMARTLERIRQNIRQRVLAPPALNSNDVLALTGPPQFNVTAREMKIPRDIADVVPEEKLRRVRFSPFIRNRILVCPPEALNRQSRDNLFAVHWFYNSWVQDVNAGIGP